MLNAFPEAGAAPESRRWQAAHPVPSGMQMFC